MNRNKLQLILHFKKNKRPTS